MDVIRRIIFRRARMELLVTAVGGSYAATFLVFFYLKWLISRRIQSYWNLPRRLDGYDVRDIETAEY